MRLCLYTSLLAIALLSVITPVCAFDDDFEINNINLDEENFLDIKAHRFRKSLEYQWYDNTTGWRMTGASLDSDIAFLQTEVKLQHELSEYLNVRLQVEQEVFYANKDFPLPTAEVELYPWAGDAGISLLGTPSREKSEMDLGIALIWGRQPWNYTRVEYLDVNALYNQKNITDNSFYSKDPRTMTLEGGYRLGEYYKVRFKVRRDRPLELIDPDSNSEFTHKASDYFLLFDYLPSSDSVIGITINGFTLDKSSIMSGLDQSQDSDYFSADIYWVSGMGREHEIRLGTQYDHISNDFRDYLTSGDNLDYYMKTLQVYTSAYHPFNEHMAWDLGLHVGLVKEEENYPQQSSKNIYNESVQAKFRMGFEYSSSDGRNSLQFNISLNLDDVFKDPGDGGGISFQSVF